MSAQPKSAITAAPSGAALAQLGPVATVLQSAGVLDAVMQGNAHLVSPIVAIDSLSAMTSMSVRMVRVDVVRETYPQSSGKVSLTKVALDKIAGAAQIDWAYCGQVDDWNDPHHVKYHAVAVVTNPDGTKSRKPGTKVVDLRKAAGYVGEDAAGMSDRELAQARKHIHSLCESKAKNRAIRSLGIPQAMTPADAALPWVVVAIVPNAENPAIRAAMVESLVPTQALLYGRRAQQPMPALPEEIEAGEERRDAIDVSDMVEEPTPAEPGGETPAEGPAPAGQGGALLAGVKIEVLSEKPGPNDETGKPKWTRYGVKVGDDWLSTFSATMAATARAAKAQGAAVTVEYTVDEKGYKNLTAITPGTQRDLPLEPAPAAPVTPAPVADAFPAEPAGADLDACPLPLSDEQIFSVPANQEHRVKALGMINAAFEQLVALRGPREARAIARKLADGLHPVTTPFAELRAVWEALRAEVAGGGR